MIDPRTTLLDADDPPVTSVSVADGRSPFVLACDHADNRLPRRLGTLGLETHHLERHIAYDIGAFGVAERLAALLDAPLIAQRYSRLAIDCNRQPSARDSVPIVGEDTAIPGNRNVRPFERRARIDEIFTPYHAAVAALLDRRRAARRPTVLVTVHSFTPVFRGYGRPWDIGILYNRDARLPLLLLEMLRADGRLCVGDNQPYYVSDTNDYTIPVHGERRGIPNVEIEIRQDLVTATQGQALWAGRLAKLLERALERLDPATTPP